MADYQSFDGVYTEAIAVAEACDAQIDHLAKDARRRGMEIHELVGGNGTSPLVAVLQAKASALLVITEHHKKFASQDSHRV